MDAFSSLGHQVKTLEELRNVAPAVFSTQPKSNVTKQYSFVNTENIVKDIQSLGWELHSAKQSGLDPSSRHLVRFVNPKIGYMDQVKGDKVQPQIILDNSHNRGSSTQLHMGLFRLVCTNGLVTAIPGMYDNIKFRHMGVNFEELKNVLDITALQYAKIGDHVADMQDVMMHQTDREEFAVNAIARREPHLFINEDGTINMKKITASTNPLEIIKPIRGEDEANNLWTVFNVIQERMIKGGYHRMTAGGRNSTTRGITSGTRNVDFNKELWTMAETYIPEAELVG